MTTTTSATPRHVPTFVLWALNAKVGRWLPILRGLKPEAAVDEMTTRQDRIRRSNHACAFKVLPEGEVPH
jgi:hypothetical protein